MLVPPTTAVQQMHELQCRGYRLRNLLHATRIAVKDKRLIFIVERSLDLKRRKKNLRLIPGVNSFYSKQWGEERRKEIREGKLRVGGGKKKRK